MLSGSVWALFASSFTETGRFGSVACVALEVGCDCGVGAGAAVVAAVACWLCRCDGVEVAELPGPPH